EIDPDFFWSWHNLGDALTKLQQWDRAVLVYRRAVEIDPDFFWSWHNLGDALTKLQQWDRAIAVYLQAIMLQSDRQVVYQKLGTVFKQRGSLKDSIRDYRQLIQSGDRDNIYRNLKTNPETLLAIAEALVIEHQTHAGIVLYYMALEIQSDRPAILVKLAELLQQQNQLQKDIASNQSTLQSELLTRQQSNIIAQAKPDNIPGEIIVQHNCSISPEQLEDLFSTVGWSRRPLDRVKQSLDRSFGYVAAWHIYGEKESLIGFARAVSDGVFHATLLDILVAPRFQQRGLGKKIVLALIEQLQQSQINDITLFASPHIVDFYHKLGFVSQPKNLQWMLWGGGDR
ncbi:GNAT family N-acetyltransferase, partial [Waterburya agarophytonicola K14]